MKLLLISAVVMLKLVVLAQAQTRSSLSYDASNQLNMVGYVEAYYSYDFNKPSSNTRPGFFYNHNRHNEFNINLAFLKGTYTDKKLRANVAVATGTYINANYAAEPGVLKNIYEANAGYKLSRKKNLWLDMGILPSHIGFESAVSKDDWALTRSMVAENSPYFESGARLSYGSDSEKLTVSLLALNGWQRITRVEGNSLMSFGTQVYYKPSEKVTINYSTFFGTDKPDSARLKRAYHNVYGIFQFNDRVGLTAGLDFGLEDKVPNSDHNNTWHAPVVILRITPIDKWAFALRAEHFSDENGVIIRVTSPNGFRTSGISGNIDFTPGNNAALRLEIRLLRSNDPIFTAGNGTMSNTNTCITFSTAVTF